MRRKSLVLILFLAVVLFTASALAVEPFGASPTEINSTRAPSDAAGNNSALAGNVTELNILGFSNTQAWQGYFGNVSGTIQLADADDKIMYNWSLASPRGEVYASNASSITWATIACFDWATQGEGLETDYGIDPLAVDGVNETFNVLTTHNTFYTNNIEFNSTVNNCMTSQLYDDTGASVANKFAEVLQTDGTNTIFTAILENDATGFDGRSHDFQMMVLDNGHGTNTATTTYFFWVELE